MEVKQGNHNMGTKVNFREQIFKESRFGQVLSSKIQNQFVFRRYSNSDGISGLYIEFVYDPFFIYL